MTGYGIIVATKKLVQRCKEEYHGQKTSNKEKRSNESGNRKAQLTEEKKTQSAEEKVAEKVSDTAKEIKATAKTAARTAVKEAKAAKETVKKTAAKEVKGAKEAVKKTAAKRPSKKDMKVRTFVEYYGKQVEEKEMIARVKKAWTKKGKRVGEIKTLELYVKPEEGAVYYVINSEETGAVEY